MGKEGTFLFINLYNKEYMKKQEVTSCPKKYVSAVERD